MGVIAVEELLAFGERSISTAFDEFLLLGAGDIGR